LAIAGIRYIEISEMFMAYLLTRNSRIEEDLIDQLFNSTEKRLARLLLLLANFGKDGRTEPVIGKFSQETLAEMIGTTRSRVSFFMNKFRKLGYIDSNGKLEIHNFLLNVVLYDNPEIKTKNTGVGRNSGPQRRNEVRRSRSVAIGVARCLYRLDWSGTAARRSEVSPFSPCRHWASFSVISGQACSTHLRSC
jgi:Crp-like helix-turn-helix domain